MNPYLLFNTVRYLKPIQIKGQIIWRIKSRLENPAKIAGKPVPVYPGCRWKPAGPFASPIPPGRGNKAAIKDGSFSFLNQDQKIGWPPDWGGVKLPRLWQYNLHYFEWIWALDFEDAAAAASSWIKNHPLRKGAVGWEPGPISQRLQNWLAYFWGNHQRETEARPDFKDRLWRSVFMQAEWLSNHLETHILGNHLFDNGASLALAGSCFAGEEPQRWLETGVGILKKEIPEQILPDGMHFERSPSYHAGIIRSLLPLYNTGENFLQQLTAEPLSRMVKALRKLCHPDGEIALFNDSAFGIQKSPDELTREVSRLIDIEKDSTSADGAWALPDAGYYGFRGGEASYVIFDAGPIGPDYLPGHAHGDIFSFELSLNGQRVIVDSGVFDYEIGKMREYCRSTRAHNTVEINNKDQCEFWSAFRVGRRARIRDVEWLPFADGFELSARHDGYQRLPGRPIHTRRAVWKAKGLLKVNDEIKSSKELTAISRLHLHPVCEVEKSGDKTAIISFNQSRFLVTWIGEGSFKVEDSLYCPEFGVKLPNRVLSFSFSGRNPTCGFIIEKI